MKCHEDITDGIRSTRHKKDDIACTNCHRNVGHQH
jgi:hypothetical protein